ncbi:MAG TPA: PIN domain-containing protein [Verrucomicrobiae bacterium]
MSYLLDVSSLLALLSEAHTQHKRVDVWQEKQRLAVCPISELGFVRLSTNPSVGGATMADARRTLKDWLEKRKPEFIPCDAALLDTDPAPGSAQTTDFYLAGLAEKHGMQLATLDQGIKHKAVFLIPT